MIIVTGGAGFIGSAIVWKLNRLGIEDILIVDSLKQSEKWRNLVHLRFHDFCEKERFLELFEDGKFPPSSIEGIIHLGACSSTLQKDASYLMENNYRYSQVLMQWSVLHKKRFVYASSAATYGDGSRGFSDDHQFLTSQVPLNIYAYSKHLLDVWALRNRYLNWCVGIKYFNVYGPNEYHKEEMRSVVIKAFEQIREKKEVALFKSHIPQYEDGGQLRDFLYVKDAADMTVFLYLNEHCRGIYNVGSGNARSFHDLTASVFNAMNIKKKIRYIPMPLELRQKYQYFTEAKIDKLVEAGYCQRINTLEEGVCDYVQNYLLKEDPYLKTIAEELTDSGDTCQY